MSPNIGNIDKTIRILVGILLLTQVFTGLHTPWGWVGLLPLITAFVSFCPVYKVLGLHTNKANSLS